MLVVGSGAREHAIAWKLKQSPKLRNLYIAPGNAGTAALGVNIDVPAANVEMLVDAAREHQVDLVIVGPEEPLARGLVDRLEDEGIPAFGPRKAAARIESSKAFAKELMLKRGIPTAPAAIFRNRHDARNYVQSLARPVVVKADGLAAGKGVFVCESADSAIEAIDRIMGEASTFGESGAAVVIEERLSGREVSAHAFTDGQAVAPMPFACDYKRALDGDRGPNTGGMGAYSPPLWLDEAIEQTLHQEITERVIGALEEEGAPYKGVLYPGLMITGDGPRVLEFNARFGDPEAQVILPRLKSDLLEICWAVAQGQLSEAEIEWSTDACVGVVLASGGYPESYETGFPIVGLGALDEGVLVFHAGTRVDDEGRVVTAGGRVLTVVACAPTLQEARALVYRNVQRIHFTRVHYRRDIAAPAQDARTE